MVVAAMITAVYSVFHTGVSRLYRDGEILSSHGQSTKYMEMQYLMPAEFVHANWSLANLVLVITYIMVFSAAGECSLKGSSKNKE